MANNAIRRQSDENFRYFYAVLPAHRHFILITEVDCLLKHTMECVKFMGVNRIDYEQNIPVFRKIKHNRYLSTPRTCFTLIQAK